MKNAILMILLCGTIILNAQSSVEELTSQLSRTYETEQLNELISLSDVLPLTVPANPVDSALWHEAREDCVKVYLLWYQKMFANRYRLDDRKVALHSQYHIDTLQTQVLKEMAINSNIKNTNKNNSIGAFLIAEQRLKFFIKNSFKANRIKNFQKLLLSFEDSYDITVAEIMDKVLMKRFGFVVYENKINKKEAKLNSDILVRN